MSITVCKMKLAISPIFEKMGPSAKLHNITIVTLTKLLAISIVANRRSGYSRSFLIALPLGVSSSSSSCEGVNEKYAISLPEMNPEIRSESRAMERATICPMPIWAIISVAGNGSISKIFEIS